MTKLEVLVATRDMLPPYQFRGAVVDGPPVLTWNVATLADRDAFAAAKLPTLDWTVR